jgi:hypothetical protein
MKVPPAGIQGGVAHQLEDTEDTQHHRAITSRSVRAFQEHSLFHFPISSNPPCNIPILKTSL